MTGEAVAAFTAVAALLRGLTPLTRPLIVLAFPPNFLNDLSSVCLWSVNKKKPLSTVKQAHGCHGDTGLEQPHWVASVAALQNSDTVASGASGCESLLYQILTTTCSHFIMCKTRYINILNQSGQD